MNQKFEFVWFVLTSDCNSECSYCWVRKTRKKIENITEDVAIASLHFISKNCVEGAEIQFFGGEPLLKFDVIKYCMNVKPNWFFTMFTNGKLFDMDKLDFFRDHGDFIRIIFSLDGDVYTQNKNRGFWPEHMSVIKRAFSDLPFTGIRMTVTDPNMVYTDAEYLCSLGCPRVDINSPNMVDLPVDYYDILRSEVSRIKSSYFGSRVHFIDICQKGISPCAIGTRRISISPDGSLYPCDVFGMIKEFKVGDVWNGVNEDSMKSFINFLPSIRGNDCYCSAEKYIRDTDWILKNTVK